MINNNIIEVEVPLDDNSPVSIEVVDNVRGERGYSAYEVWLLEGNEGSVQDYLAYTKGERGEPFRYSDFTGEQLELLKVKGDTGSSAYQIALKNGFTGTDEEWLQSLIGPVGKSAGIAHPTVKVTTLSPDMPAEVKITASGEDTAKVFDFDIKIPKGGIGGTGETGATGKSAYQIAVDNGYIGTEQQFGIEQAVIAGNSARLTSVEASKANLIDGIISPDEISSLQGRQTGVRLYGNSYYSQSIADANFGHNSFSVEFYFNYDVMSTAVSNVYNMAGIIDENSRSMCSIYRQSTGAISMYINNRSESGVYEQIGFNISLNGNNHIVLTVDRINKLFNCYINGELYRTIGFQTPISYTAVNKIIIGDNRPNNEAQPFIAKHFRVFNHILSLGEVNKLYGFGNPELFSIDYKLNMNETNRCIYEYLPAGVLLTKWRATIGGVDLPALGLSENKILDYKKNLALSLAPLFIARGAVLNNNTGFYELNGLTDITSNEMERIYAYSNSFIPIPYNLRSSTIRTNFRSAGAYWACDLTNTFASSSLAVINLMGGYYVNSFTNAFNNCRLLKSIIGDLVCFDGTTALNSIFNGDISLESFSLANLYRSISIADSPLLNRETIMYMIDKSKNTTPITITLHATAKARLTEADVALAVSKNITIA